MFFTLYAKIDGVSLVPAWLEGREVVAVFENRADPKPSYIMRLEWHGDQINFIHDYRYVTTAAELTLTTASVSDARRRARRPSVRDRGRRQGLRMERRGGKLVVSAARIVDFAKNFPALVFQPSDPEPDARLSIAAWVKAVGVTNVRAPIAPNASQSDWPISSADEIICINMVHISQGEAALDRDRCALLRHYSFSKKVEMGES